MRDPYIDQIIDYLQPFIDGKVSHQCDLERQAQVSRFDGQLPRSGHANRHKGHTWCHDNPFVCACPCHWTEDQVAYKLIEVMKDYDPEPVVATWLGAYTFRQVAEAKRLRSLANGRDQMVVRVTEALSGCESQAPSS